MAKFIIYLNDECGHQFAVEVDAPHGSVAYENAVEDYPECEVVDVVSPRTERVREVRA